MDTFLASKATAWCGMSDGVQTSIGEMKMEDVVISKMFRLFGVSESLDNNGKYQLTQFENKLFNKVVREGKIENMILKVTSALYGHGKGAFVTPIISCNSSNVINFYPGIDDDRYKIRNIIDLIDAVPRRSLFYIASNGSFADHRWFVAVYQDTVYSG